MKKYKEIKINRALLNTIAPIGISHNRNSLTLGENVCKIHGIIKYNDNPDYGWLEKITNVPGTIAAIAYKPLDDGSILDVINKNVSRANQEASMAKSTLVKQRAEREALNGAKTLKQIDEKKESVGLVGTCIMAYANDDEEFTKVERHVKSVVKGAKCKERLMSNQQLKAYKLISPTFVDEDESVSDIIDRVSPLRTIMGGFPFSASGLNDGDGTYFAKDANGGLIFLDQWLRRDDRTNSNMLVTGLPGVGKTTILKFISIIQYMLGTKIIFIDPEREMMDLVRNLNGAWINAAGGSKGRINPLQIVSVCSSEDSDEDDNFTDQGMGDMARYINHLSIFFKLRYPLLDDIQQALLKDCIIDLYNSHGIFFDRDTSKLSPEEFPILEELYQLILSKYAESNDSDYEKLLKLIKDMADGVDALIWNGFTTLDTDNQCICLDTNDLQDAPDEIKTSQYFNLLSWAWHKMTRDRDEKVMLICGESYLMVDPKCPQSLVFLRNTVKRCRKYEGAVVLDTHDIVDFLDPSVKMYGQALLSLPTYKIFMGTDGQNLEEMTKLYKLTKAEQDLLESKKRGEGLFVAGSKRMKVKFEIPDYKLEMMGKSGGR